MASVTLSFAPPDADESIVALRIYESSTATGPFNQIERTTSVGTAPDYIDEYETTLAVAADDWFAITWENAGGTESELSVPIKGGTSTWVGEVTRRVLQRDSSQDERIVVQEAEAAIESIGIDPYSDVSGAKYQQLVGLTYLVLARATIATSVITAAASQNIQGATLGLVSFKSDVNASSVVKSQNDIDALLDLANQYLGISTSYVMQLQDIVGEIGISSYDQSRLIGWIGLQ